MTRFILAPYMARLREWIERCAGGGQCVGSRPADEDPFNRLALELFAIQYEHNPVYRRFCEARKAAPAAVGAWQEIPAIPVVAFKEGVLSCLQVEEQTTVFYSSGTSGQRPSRHVHSAESLALYEQSVSAWFQAHFGVANADAARVEPALLMLTPPPVLAPHSSLVHMLDTIRRKRGVAPACFTGRLDATGAWAVDATRTVEMLEGWVQADRPVWVLGTAFNFVHLLDHLAPAGRRIQVPEGSCVMETGGYKGRSRTLRQSELHGLITERLGVPQRQIVCEYGMCELSSQAYDRRLPCPAADGEHASRLEFAPWARMQIISPETGREVAEGDSGLIRVLDLANASSVCAVQTEDIGVRRGTGFELLGRGDGTEPRGCSLMAV